VIAPASTQRSKTSTLPAAIDGAVAPFQGLQLATIVYHYPGCDTCRRALKWLRAADIAHGAVHIVDQPPTAQQLSEAQRRSGLPLRAFFNTSGQSYREGGFSARLPTMDEAAQFAALAADGKLIKRPLLIGDDVVLVGFKEALWADALGR
jgi:arsenate reductase (glutaredoxin)